MRNVTLRPRFEVLKMKFRRGPNGSSQRVAEHLNQTLKPSQRLVYLKHNTLVNDTAYWTAIIENAPAYIVRPGCYRPISPVFANLPKSVIKKKGRHANTRRK